MVKTKSSFSKLLTLSSLPTFISAEHVDREFPNDAGLWAGYKEYRGVLVAQWHQLAEVLKD